jgi:DNA-binding NarL/FixJ family response regulator
MIIRTPREYVISDPSKPVGGYKFHSAVTTHDLGLTPRQGEILSLVLQGFSNKRIAQAFNLAESTVKEHVSGILERMGVSKRMEISHMLNTKRWIFLPPSTVDTSI